MTARFDGQVVLITGAGRGIGRATALEFADRGATVVAVDRDDSLLRALEPELKTLSDQSFTITMDLTDLQQVRSGVQAVLKELGQIDVLVNNAGWDKAEPFVQSDESTWEKVIGINLMGQIATCHSILPQMIERQSGKIVNVGSDAARVGSTGEAVYSAAKGGVIAFTKTLAREVARYGVNVNCVCPGPTDTPLFAEMAVDTPNLMESLKRVIPMRRLGTPQDIAWAIVFLASGEAPFITGQTLSVSGGLTMA